MSDKEQAVELARQVFAASIEPGKLAEMVSPDYKDTRPVWETDPRFLNPFEELPEITTWLKIGERPALPKKGLITIEAKPKQGKSFCAYGLSIPILSGRKFDAATPTEKPELIIVFDAEMSKLSLIPRYRAIRASIKENANNFLIVPMLAVPQKDRWAMVEQITEQYKPEIIVIDHIGKFCGNVNDQDESNKITAYLEKLKAERTVIVISHVTTGDNTKMYGAVGTKLDNEQCERYAATCANGVYELKIISARDTSTENAAPFCFTVSVDSEHTPIEFIDASAKIQAAREKEVEGWVSDFSTLFGDDTELRKKDLMRRVIRQLNPHATEQEISDKLENSDTTASNKIKKAVELGVIRKRDNTHTAPYILTQ